MAPGLEADGVDSAIDLRDTEDLSDLVLGSPFETSTVSQPKLRAWARRSLTRSATITTAAPSSCRAGRCGQPDGPGTAT